MKPRAGAQCGAWLPHSNLLLFTCGLSGRISEKPDGGLSRHSFSDGDGVQPSLRGQAEKA